MVSLPWMTLLPVLILAAGTVAVLVLDIAWPAARQAHLALISLTLVAAGASTIPGVRISAGDSLTALCAPSGGLCLYEVSAAESLLQLLACVSALLVVLLAWRDWAHCEGGRTAVLSALLLAATTGVVALPGVGDVASLLVAIELATLPTVALVALEHRSRRQPGAIDAAVALLTTSLASFALLALGAALWFVSTGTAILSPEALVGQTGPDRVVLELAGVFALAGIAFKLSAVPFHAWTPVTYAAAPLPVTAYLSTTSKVAAVGGLLVLVQAVTGAGVSAVGVALGVVAALSLTLGHVIALVQRDSVGLLAWSSVAQGGWVVLPLATLAPGATSLAVGYLVIYLLATMALWIVIVALANDPARPDGTSLHWMRGILRRQPALGLAMLFALLTLAGLPPAVAGLLAKIGVISPVAAQSFWWLAIVAAINVPLGLAVYLRWAWLILDPLPSPDSEAQVAKVVLPPLWSVVLGLLTATLIALSIWPVMFR